VSLLETISKEQRQRLWFEFTKSLIDRRILYKGKKVEKYEVFSTFLSKSVTIPDMIILGSHLITNSLENYKVVWKWELFGYKDRESSIR